MDTQKGEVIAIAGMPGSGKSKFIKNEFPNHVEFDDLYGDGWKLPKAKQDLAEGKNIIVSDIEFCREHRCKEFEAQIGRPGKVRWIFFKNDPFRCGCNVLYRKYVENRDDRSTRTEIGKIGELRLVYKPPADARPVLVDHVIEALHSGVRH